MASIEELLEEGGLAEISPDASVAQGFLSDAVRHFENAELILDRGDVNGAYALAYDAARKAITAHMRLTGYRLRNRPRAHQAIVDYAREALEDPALHEALANLDRIRRTRYRGEYEAAYLDAGQARHDMLYLGAIVDAVRIRMSGEDA
jgi:HEPN domain-containing protein